MKRFYIIIVACVLMIICTEFFLRWKYEVELEKHQYPLIYTPDNIYGYKYIPNSRSVLQMPGMYKNFTLNNYGYYSPNFEKNKKDGVYRILVVGASTAGGIWMNGPKSYSLILEQMFKRNKYNVEVINCSIDGDGRDKRHLDLIRRELVTYRPDLILLEMSFPLRYANISREVYRGYVVEYLINSIESRKRALKIVDYLHEQRVLSFLYDKSFIVRALFRDYSFHDGVHIRQHPIHSYVHKNVSYTSIYWYSVKKSIELIKATEDTVNKHGGKMVLLNYGALGSKTDSVFKLKGISSLDLNVKFDSSYMSLPDEHFNQKGHNLIADSLYVNLLRRFPIHKQSHKSVSKH